MTQTYRTTCDRPVIHDCSDELLMQGYCHGAGHLPALAITVGRDPKTTKTVTSNALQSQLFDGTLKESSGGVRAPRSVNQG